MFAKSQRLTSSFLIQKTIQKGDTIKTPFFVLKILNVKLSNAILKITVIVSTKINKRSTVRNRVKRIFREAIKKVIKKIDGQAGGFNFKGNLVFFPHPSTVAMKSTELEGEIKKVFL